MKSIRKASGTYRTAGPRMASGLEQSGGERVGVDSQQTKTRREDEVDPARLVLTEEQEGGEKEQQRWRRHVGGFGLHPG